jgi:integrase/recombinase XerD
MPGKQAQRITPPMLRRMLRYASQTSFPARDRAMILLSVKAGLRACEIARLEWSMVIDARGRIADTIAVRDAIAKKRSGRRIPMHPDLKRALQVLLRRCDPEGPVIRSGHLRPNSIVNWFAVLFVEPGFDGCSSHSGRRTFITSAARNTSQRCLSGTTASNQTQRQCRSVLSISAKDFFPQRTFGRASSFNPSLPTPVCPHPTENAMTENHSSSSDKFRDFVKKIARLLVPEDDAENMSERRKQAAQETGSPLEEVTDADVIVNADDEFLCSETLTLWMLIRESRELLKSSGA